MNYAKLALQNRKKGSIQAFGKYIKSCVMPLDFVISG